MAQRYFGNTFSDLQSALTAADQIAAQRDAASAANSVQFARSSEQASAQRAALQQQAAQQAAANDFANRQLAQQSYFQRGQLTNEEKRIAAELELAKANAAATAAWRQEQLQPRLDANRIAADADAQTAALFATRVEGIAKARTDHDRLTADLAKLTALETAQTEQSKLPSPTGTGSRFFRGMAETAPLPLRPLGFDPLGANRTTGFRSEATRPDGSVIGGVDIAGAKKRVQAKLDEVRSVLDANRDLLTMTTQAPDGSWVSAYKPPVPTVLGVAPTAGTSTNAVPAVLGGGGVAVPVGVTNAPSAIFTTNNPAPPPAETLLVISTQAQFDALPSGAIYVGSDGRRYRKP